MGRWSARGVGPIMRGIVGVVATLLGDSVQGIVHLVAAAIILGPLIAMVIWFPDDTPIAFALALLAYVVFVAGIVVFLIRRRARRGRADLDEE